MSDPAGCCCDKTHPTSMLQAQYPGYSGLLSVGVRIPEDESRFSLKDIPIASLVLLVQRIRFFGPSAESYCPVL